MTITREDQDGKIVLTLSGQIDSKTAKAFEEEINRALGDEQSGIVIDCADLAFISSAGLRIFLIAAKKLKPRKRSLAVCSLQPLVADIFQTTGLPGILTIFLDRESALAGG